MDLAKRDAEIQHLHNLMKESEHFLSEKHKTLIKTQKDNPYLKEVVNNYNMYFSGIAQQNQAQYNALQTLADYITQILLDPTTDAETVKQCKQDMKMVQQELATNLLRKG